MLRDKSLLREITFYWLHNARQPWIFRNQITGFQNYSCGIMKFKL